MKSQLTAQNVFDFLSHLQREGCNLNNIKINYRYDFNSDVEKVRIVSEDLYDTKTNNKLESIIFITTNK